MLQEFKCIEAVTKYGIMSVKIDGYNKSMN